METQDSPENWREVGSQVTMTKPSYAERTIEVTIYRSRWMLFPFHIGLLLAVFGLLAKSLQITLEMVRVIFSLTMKQVIITSLSLIELVLIASLILIVVFNSYEGFVSRLDAHGERRERLQWGNLVGFEASKHRLMASVSTICGVYLLERIVDGTALQGSDIVWIAVGFALLVTASVVMERFSASSH